MSLGSDMLPVDPAEALYIFLVDISIHDLEDEDFVVLVGSKYKQKVRQISRITRH